MAKRTFTVSAIWDEEAGVFYSESDIIGLHVETATIEEFENVMFELAPELIVANHITKPEATRRSLQDLIPAILWQRPVESAQVA